MRRGRATTARRGTVWALAVLSLGVPAGCGDDDPASAGPESAAKPPAPVIGKPTLLDASRRAGDPVRVEIPVTYSTRRPRAGRRDQANTAAVSVRVGSRRQIRGSSSRLIGDRGRVTLRHRVTFSPSDSAAIRAAARKGEPPPLAIAARHSVDTRGDGTPETSANAARAVAAYPTRRLTGIAADARLASGSSDIQINVRNLSGGGLVVSGTQITNGKITDRSGDDGTAIPNDGTFWINANASSRDPRKPAVLLVSVSPPGDSGDPTLMGAAYTFFAPNQYCAKPAANYEVGTDGSAHGDARVGFAVGASTEPPKRQCSSNEYWNSDN